MDFFRFIINIYRIFFIQLKSLNLDLYKYHHAILSWLFFSWNFQDWYFFDSAPSRASSHFVVETRMSDLISRRAPAPGVLLTDTPSCRARNKSNQSEQESTLCWAEPIAKATVPQRWGNECVIFQLAPKICHCRCKVFEVICRSISVQAFGKRVFPT